MGSMRHINIKKVIQGHALERAKSALLKNYNRYKLSDKEDDKFELFLPSQFIDEKATFSLFLKNWL